MFKKSKSDSKSYGIIGLGRFGSALAVELAKSGAEPLVIDGNEEKVREMREYTENAFVVSSFDKKTLSETGIQNCDVVVVCPRHAIPYLAALQRSHKRNNDRRSTEENPAFTRNPQQTPM